MPGNAFLRRRGGREAQVQITVFSGEIAQGANGNEVGQSGLARVAGGFSHGSAMAVPGSTPLRAVSLFISVRAVDPSGPVHRLFELFRREVVVLVGIGPVKVLGDTAEV